MGAISTNMFDSHIYILHALSTNQQLIIDEKCISARILCKASEANHSRRQEIWNVDSRWHWHFLCLKRKSLIRLTARLRGNCEIFLVCFSKSNSDSNLQAIFVVFSRHYVWNQWTSLWLCVYNYNADYTITNYMSQNEFCSWS